MGVDLDIYSTVATSVGTDLGIWYYSGHSPLDRSSLSLELIQSEGQNARIRVDRCLPLMLRSELQNCNTHLETDWMPSRKLSRQVEVILDEIDVKGVDVRQCKFGRHDCICGRQTQ